MTLHDLLELGPAAIAAIVSVSGAVGSGAFWGCKFAIRYEFRRVRAETAELEMRVAKGYVSHDDCRAIREDCDKLRAAKAAAVTQRIDPQPEPAP